MADKEERIEISTYDLNNKEWNGDIPIDIHKVYTRQETIQVMSDALYSNVFITREHAVKGAEAALNALLGVEK